MCFCRNTTAKPAVNPHQQKRQPNAQKKHRLLDFHLNFKCNYYTNLQLVSIHTDTYCIRIHNQCTYTLVCILYGTERIQTRTEPLRKKRVFTEYFLPERCYFYVIKNYLINKNKSTFAV